MDDIKLAMLGNKEGGQAADGGGGAGALPVVWEDGSSR